MPICSRPQCWLCIAEGRRLLAADPDDHQVNYGYGIGSLEENSELGDGMSGRTLLATAKSAAATGVTPSSSKKYSFLSPPTNEGTVKFLLVRPEPCH